MNKNRPAQKWNANLYDDKHKFVSEYGSDLLTLLLPREGELILDLGCGTGDLANEINRSGAKIIGVDASEDMISQAVGKFPKASLDGMYLTRDDIECINKDVKSCPFFNEGKLQGFKHFNKDSIESLMLGQHHQKRR